jgi:starvation-inducible DNA-binding protein
MTTILQSMRQVLADTFLMYAHAHIAHWNVEGPDFFENHQFLNNLYDELWEAVDGIAEHIRPLGAFAPITLASLIAEASIDDTDPGRSWEQIRQRLYTENQQVMASLVAAFESAQDANDQGLMNFLADRIDKHSKHGWMLRASHA